MPRIERREEIAILTLAEKRILEKAYDILDEIYDESEGGNELCRYAESAKAELDDFLSNEDIYEVENSLNPSIKITIEI